MVAWRSQLDEIENNMCTLKKLDEALISSTVVSGELLDMFKAALNAGFRMPPHYAIHILIQHCENHVRLAEGEKMKELLSLEVLQSGYCVPKEEAQSSIDLIIETTLSRLIKQLVKKDLKTSFKGPSFQALEDRGQ